MEWVLPIVVGTLYAAGIYLILRRSMLKLMLGVILLSHAASLLVFTSAGLTREHPPIIPSEHAHPPTPYADPLPQAMVLTAIVISFGVVSFGVALMYRAYWTTGSDDLDDMVTTER